MKKYYCPECKRYHHRGKIYKEHLKYIQNKKEPSKVQISQDVDLKDVAFEDLRPIAQRQILSLLRRMTRAEYPEYYNMDDFMQSQFNHPNEYLVFAPGQFSRASLRIIRKKIDNLIKEYNQLAEMDATLPIKGRYSTGLLIGFRPWVFTMIANLRRKK